ncbi:hypothetical protein ACHAXN_012158 [Cyclotella atomus]
MSSYGGRGGRSGRGGRGKPNPSNQSSQAKLNVCRNFASTGNCTHGDRCNFAHVVKMHASVIAADKNPDAKPSYHGGYSSNNTRGKSKDYYKVTSVAVWETQGAIKLFTGSHDGKWRLWNTAGGALTKEFEHFVGGPIDTVHLASHFFFVGFEAPPKEAPDAKAGMVHSWNLNSPADPPLELCISSMASYASSGRIRSLWTTADGTVFSGGTDGVIRQWAFNPTGGFALVGEMSGHLGAISGIALAGPFLWSGGMDGTIRLWKPESGENCHLIPSIKKDNNGAQTQGAGHSGPITGLLPFDAPNNAGTFVFTSSLDETVKVWNAANGECVASETHGQGVTSIALTADLKGNPLLLCGLFYGDIMIRGTISNPPLVLLMKLSHQFIGVGHEVGPVNNVQPGPGNTFYAVADDGKLTVWQITGDFGL